MEKEQKKEYTMPALKVIELKNQANLLQSSDPSPWNGEGN